MMKRTIGMIMLMIGFGWWMLSVIFAVKIMNFNQWLWFISFFGGFSIGMLGVLLLPNSSSGVRNDV